MAQLLRIRKLHQQLSQSSEDSADTGQIEEAEPIGTAAPMDAPPELTMQYSAPIMMGAQRSGPDQGMMGQQPQMVPMAMDMDIQMQQQMMQMQQQMQQMQMQMGNAGMIPASQYPTFDPNMAGMPPPQFNPYSPSMMMNSWEAIPIPQALPEATEEPAEGMPMPSSEVMMYEASDSDILPVATECSDEVLEGIMVDNTDGKRRR